MASSTRRVLTVTASAVALGLVLAACSGGSSDSGSGDGTAGGSDGGSSDALDAALEQGGTIEYWTWTPQAEEQAAAFMKAYPNVTVNVTNTGGAADHNLKLQNALTAGSGIPDVAQLEYQSVSQFQLPGSLTDLTEYGFADLEDLYTPSTWGAVTQNGGIWGLPQDSGPMALFYNEEVFTSLGIEVPTTWDEYITAGEAIKAANPDTCIVNDSGDAGFTTSMIWQAGGRPFAVDGENVTINLQDEGSKLWADTWNKIVQGGLNCEIPGWTDEWFAALSDGTIATLPTGAWMPGVFENSAPDGAGKWRVAPMPTYDGTPANAENGGSTEVVPKGAPNPELGAAFLRWLNSDPESISVFLNSGGGFPATVAELQSDEFLGFTSDYFGGQEINKVLVEGIDNVGTGWQYLPWQSYANSIVSETLGQSYLNRTDLNEGLVAWQDANVKYGEEQGFTVSTE
ncbi:sugar ABC transporter substrate-binding protein [Miniimonas arenae]|uniref:Sugar ABC transporter substrate-binding protein n=1 Tax=Miniimonas arenae TaxID=676201 RepID=A0A5C5BBI6_9MICO|nr:MULTISPECIES: sugar ABC transporter substrate-binding protein [Miniimonas]TNU73896.1 sugar ABC transporter substrate-binding protein [Miniimonas arenae]